MKYYHCYRRAAVMTYKLHQLVLIFYSKICPVYAKENVCIYNIV